MHTGDCPHDYLRPAGNGGPFAFLGGDVRWYLFLAGGFLMGCLLALNFITFVYYLNFN